MTFEVLTGATHGKRAMGLLVIQDDGTPVGLPASLIRNLLRSFDFLLLFYGVCLVCTVVNRDFRRLGDLAAGTLVIHGRHRSTPAGVAPELAGRSALQPPPETALVPSPASRSRQLPPGLPIATQQTILAFCERARGLSGARRIELAETLPARLSSPPSGLPARGWAAVAQVEGYGTWLACGRARD